MERSQEKLEQRLAELLGRRHVYFTGRGATALYVALRAIGVAGKRVAVPDILCMSPANVVLAAEGIPVFCDVRPDNFTIDSDALAGLLQRCPDIRVVIASHTYGHAADMEILQEICQAHGAILIEDAAQSLGGRLGGKPLGSHGDCAIISFGRSKILDAGGGGALLTDNEDLYREAKGILSSLPQYCAEHTRLQEQFRDVYYILWRLRNVNPALDRLFIPLPEIYRNMYLYRGNESMVNNVYHKLQFLQDEIASRQKKESIYRSLLPSVPLRHPLADADIVPRDEAEGILPRCRERMQAEEDWMRRLRNGETTVEILGFDRKLEELGVEWR